MESLRVLECLSKPTIHLVHRGFQTDFVHTSRESALGATPTDIIIMIRITIYSLLKYRCVVAFPVVELQSKLNGDKDGLYCIFICQDKSHSLLLSLFYSAGCQIDTRRTIRQAACQERNLSWYSHSFIKNLEKSSLTCISVKTFLADYNWM